MKNGYGASALAVIVLFMVGQFSAQVSGEALSKAAQAGRPQRDAPASADELLKRFETALKDKNKDAITALFNWQGVSDEMKADLQEQVDDLIQQGTKSVTLRPLPADFEPESELDGVRYRLNVTVVGVISVEHARAGDSTQMPYGKNDKGFYMAGTVQERVSQPVTKERVLNVAVLGLIAPNPVSFTGSCTYSKGGKESTADISGDKGNLSKAFRGDFVKSCTVQKTSDKGWIQLVITEDGRKVFESRRVESNEPVVYEKKE